MATIHSRAMVMPRAWTTDEFADMLMMPGMFSVDREAGFALGRVVLDEVELLTLAVEPHQQRRGIGAGCLRDFEEQAQMFGAKRALLEVAATNAPARGLYDRFGYIESGRRTGYYASDAHTPVDAVLMQKTIVIA
ncbi:MAG: GNAT family N-acetyltransferase [Boseongicola sp.]|nr:MAG: GNAT family N-acetyltransferase [Boseongicola sp.]